jgi:hypothetical protein
VGIVSRTATGAAFGAVGGLVCAALLIVLPVALTDTDARQVEWLGNLLFVAVPLIALGALAGAVIAGRSRRAAQQPGSRRRAAVVAACVVAITLFTLSGTTNLLS